MKNGNLKKWLPYAGLPAICLLVLAMNLNRVHLAVLILREILCVVVYIASVGDIKEKRVPNRLVTILFGVWVLFVVPQLFFDTQTGMMLLMSGVIGFLLSGVIFLVVYIVSRKGLGGGDVKLMAVSGLYLGYNGVLPAMLYGSIFAAVTGIVLIVSKKMGPKDTIALVPFLYAGMLLTMMIR